MKTIKNAEEIKIVELTEMTEKMFGNLVKAVVDIKKNAMAIDAGLHADEEKELLQAGSKQADLWGINLYPEFFGSDDFIEFDSMINLRPFQNNRSRDIEDPKIREKIKKIVETMVIK